MLLVIDEYPVDDEIRTTYDLTVDVDPSIDPTADPTNDPTNDPTMKPTLEPINTITLTTKMMDKSTTGFMNTTTSSTECDKDCEKSSHDLLTEVELNIDVTIYYNADQLDCFLYNILLDFFQHFNLGTNFTFTVCDVDIKQITGNGIEDGDICQESPCFVSNTMSIRRRTLLQDYDGTLTLSLSTEDQDLFDRLLTNMKTEKLGSYIVTAFSSNFNLNMEVIVQIEEYDEYINNNGDDNGDNEGMEGLDGLDDEILSPDFTENQKDSGGLMGHFSGTRDQWICVGIFLSILGILFPFEIYYTYSLYKARFAPFIHTRHPEVNAYTNLLAAIFLIIERPMHAIHRLSVYNALWFQWLRLLFYYTTMQFLLGFVILRFWILLFDIKWTKSMTDKQWKKHIDTTLSDKTQSFWVRSHKTWGNYKFIWRYVVTCNILLSAIPGFLVFSKSYFVGSMAHGVLLGTGVLLLYILWKTTPIYHDEFKIMDECGFVLTWLGIAIVCDLSFTSLKIIFGETFWIWFLSFSVPFLLLTGVIFIQSYWVLQQMKRSIALNGSSSHIQFSDNEEDDEPGNMLHSPPSVSRSRSELDTMSLYQLLKDKLGCYEFIAHLLKEFSCENILSVIEMTQYKQFWLQYHTYYIRKYIKVRRQSRQQSSQKSRQQSRRISPNQQRNIIALSGFSDDEDDDDDNKEYITDYDEEEEEIKINNVSANFMRVNSDQSSVPPSNKIALADWNEDDINNNSLDPLKAGLSDDINHDLAVYGTTIIDMPRNLPLSTIVWSVPMEQITEQEMRDKAKLLYQKYIKLGCELELNISFRLRKEMNKKWAKIDKMDEIQLYTFFDNVIESMMKLMQDSFTRFRMTRGFLLYERDFLKRRNSQLTVDSMKGRIKKRFSQT